MVARRAKTRFSLPETGLTPGRRPARVAEAIREGVAMLLLRQISDPRLCHVSITKVAVGPDLKIARIYFDCRRETLKEVEAGLASARGFIRSALAGELKMRHMPQLQFCYDSGLERQEEISLLLRDIEAEK